jgi:two-component system OmpR family sensor kinase
MIRWLRHLPTRWQITALHAVLLTLVLGGVGIVVLHQQRAFLVSDTTDRLLTEAHRQSDDSLNKLAGLDSGSNEVAAADAKFQGFLRELPDGLASPDTGGAIFEPDGSLIAVAVKGLPAPIPDLKPDFIANVASTGTDATFQTEIASEPILAVFVPLQAKDNVLAVVEMTTSLQSIDDQIGRLRTYFIIGWAIAVLVTTALGVPATRRVLRPLTQLVGVTRNVAAGDLSQRIALPPSPNELAQLGTPFDSMVAQLEASFANQRRFVADAAHELRTPLTALSASTELLLIGADDADPATTQRLLRHLDRELNRLIRLTNDLLTLSALDARAPLPLSPTDLSTLLIDVGDQTRDLLNGQELRLAVDPDLVVNANPDRLRQVVLNLLDNARKYTPTGGTITLGAVARDGHILLTIEDTGIGIPRDAQSHLFDRFYRVDSARTRRTGGSGLGLGLPIVHGLVEAHGGTVAIESDSNAGTRVIVCLPRLRT